VFQGIRENIASSCSHSVRWLNSSAVVVFSHLPGPRPAAKLRIINGLLFGMPVARISVD
jgi:hypothetical protein